MRMAINSGMHGMAVAATIIFLPLWKLLVRFGALDHGVCARVPCGARVPRQEDHPYHRLQPGDHRQRFPIQRTQALCIGYCGWRSDGILHRPVCLSCTRRSVHPQEPDFPPEAFCGAVHEPRNGERRDRIGLESLLQLVRL